MKATASIATDKTDEVLRRRYREKGAIARREGILREQCPVDGLIKMWWLDGWDGHPPETAYAL